MTEYRKRTKKDWIRLIIYIIVFVCVGSISAFFLLPRYFYIWLILIVGGLLLFVDWYVKNTAFQCPECGYEFSISMFTYFISPHGPGWIYLKCPKCHKRSRAIVLKKK
ncbi:MAG TPA: hypothetical protein ENI34_03915 [candidate division WOR-3 bacterium]|uniref:Uncharacterized protein n=1 Tax=candidate division WOR-3 bacterium TaxID=2052148 RepID=A0A9C9ELF3_UNCW3|nr:hypothetical protein [candidate division WOR-3 bacterium]